jgi:hypothetical protein
MPRRVSVCLISALVAASVLRGAESCAREMEHSTQTESAPFTMAEARKALDNLIQSKAFLSSAPKLADLKAQIIAENKKASVLDVAERSGRYLGHWDIRDQEFSYAIKSASRTELFVVRGNFFPSEDGTWIAKVREASRVELFSYFGKDDFDKIRTKMSLEEVIKVLGTPPGAYYVGEAVLETPGGIRDNWMWKGSAKGFESQFPGFVSTKRYSGKDIRDERAWISNEHAIWIGFDKDLKVVRKRLTPVRLPNEKYRIGEPEPRTVDLKTLIESVSNQKSKFTIAYCWAAYSAPSRSVLPEFCKWGTKLEKKSIAVITLSLDSKWTFRRDVVAWALIDVKPGVPSFILDEESDAWSKALGIRCEPAIVIFDGKGKRVVSFESSDYKSFAEMIVAVEKTMDKLLAEK